MTNVSYENILAEIAEYLKTPIPSDTDGNSSETINDVNLFASLVAKIAEYKFPTNEFSESRIGTIIFSKHQHDIEYDFYPASYQAENIQEMSEMEFVQYIRDYSKSIHDATFGLKSRTNKLSNDIERRHNKLQKEENLITNINAIVDKIGILSYVEAANEILELTKTSYLDNFDKYKPIHDKMIAQHEDIWKSGYLELSAIARSCNGDESNYYDLVIRPSVDLFKIFGKSTTEFDMIRKQHAEFRKKKKNARRASKNE